MGYDEFLKIVSSGAPSARVAPLGQFARGVPEEPGFLDALMKGLDYFSRPARAISEAVGEFSEGPEGDPLAGAWRGLTGDYEHGTLGEQFIPKSEGADADPIEEFFKGAARLAVDIAGDPITWALTPIGRPIIGGAIKGLEKLGVGITKKLPASYVQRVDRMVLPVTTTLRRVSARIRGGKGTNDSLRMADGIDAAYVEQRVKAATPENALGKVLKEQKLDKSWGRGAKEAESLRMEAMDHIEYGDLGLGYVHDNQQVQAVAKVFDDSMRMMARDASEYRDVYGEGFKVLYPGLKKAQKDIKKFFNGKRLMGADNDVMREDMWNAFLAGNESFRGSGEVAGKAYRMMKNKLDKIRGTDYKSGSSVLTKVKGDKGFYLHNFKPLKDYVPQSLSEKGLKKLADPEDFSKFAKKLAKDNEIPVPEAEDIIRKMQNPARAGNIEYARMLKMDPELLERDPLKLLPRYAERLYGRMAFGREFGLSGEGWDTLLSSAVRKEGLNYEWGSAIGDLVKGHPARDLVMDDIARKIMGFQVMTKMGPLSTLSNATQSLNTISKDGGVNFVKGILRSSTDEGKRAGVVAYQRGIHDMLMRIAGGEGTWAGKWLQAVGFTPQEKINRLLAANSAVVTVEDMIMVSGKMTDDLLRRGVRPGGLGKAGDIADTVKNGGKLLDEAADRIALIGSDATQHATHWKDIPLAWQSPAARVALQYKSFVYQQSRFIAREVLSPARKWFVSNGKEGSIMPLARWGVLTGIGSQVVYEVRDQVRSGVGWAIGQEHEPMEYDEENPTWELLHRSMYVGGLGIAGDLVERASKRDLAGWALGPTVGDLSDLAQGITAYSKQPEDELPWDKIWKSVTRRVPGFGTVMPYTSEPVGYSRFMELIGK